MNLCPWSATRAPCAAHPLVCLRPGLLIRVVPGLWGKVPLRKTSERSVDHLLCLLFHRRGRVPFLLRLPSNDFRGFLPRSAARRESRYWRRPPLEPFAQPRDVLYAVLPSLEPLASYLLLVSPDVFVLSGKSCLNDLQNVRLTAAGLLSGKQPVHQVVGFRSLAGRIPTKFADEAPELDSPPHPLGMFLSLVRHVVFASVPLTRRTLRDEALVRLARGRMNRAFHDVTCELLADLSFLQEECLLNLWLDVFCIQLLPQCLPAVRIHFAVHVIDRSQELVKTPRLPVVSSSGPGPSWHDPTGP